MKKKIISLAIVSMFSSVAIASNAVLNVEGVIQINGTTVIGSDGKVAASALPTSPSKTMVDLSLYQPKPGVYTYQYVDNNYWSHTHGQGQAVCTEVDNIVSALYAEYSTSCVGDDGLEWSYVQTWTDNQDGTEAWTLEQPEWPKETWTQAVTVLAEPELQLALGSTTGYVELYEITQSDSEWYEVGDTYMYARNQTVSNIISEFSFAGQRYSDCIVSSVLRGHSQMSTLRVYCAGVGMITDFNPEEDYHLVSYEPNNAQRSLSAAVGPNYFRLADKKRQYSAKQGKLSQ
ncbi:hypothetical protein [Vibrio sp. WXL103]|uniref:hypothetical protein n=1 Tax=Vibrio sp. WXL103 TaxID=3450710 RepID=UPI003EC70F95